MARPAKDIHTGARSRLRDLVIYLRHLKDSAQVTYAVLSVRTGPEDAPGYRGASTLSRAARGTHLPPLETVLAYARAAGDPENAHQREATARKLWKAAAVDKARPYLVGRGRRLRQVRTTSSLGEALSRLHLRTGRLSFRAIERATAGGGNRVPRSTIHLILSGKVLPSDGQLAALLDVFDVTGADGAAWHAVRDKIENRLQPPPTPPRFTGYACADSDPAVHEYLERRERDEEIKRKAGLIRPDETYDDYEERIREKATYWTYWDPEDEGDDEPQADQISIRARLEVMVQRAAHTERVAPGGIPALDARDIAERS